MTTYLELNEYISQLNGHLTKTQHRGLLCTEVFFEDLTKPAFVVSEEEKNVFKLNTFNLPADLADEQNELIQTILAYSGTDLDKRLDKQYLIRILKSQTDTYGGVFINIGQEGKFNLVSPKEAQSYSIFEIRNFAELANLDLSDNLLEVKPSYSKTLHDDLNTNTSLDVEQSNENDDFDDTSENNTNLSNDVYSDELDKQNLDEHDLNENFEDSDDNYNSTELDNDDLNEPKPAEDVNQINTPQRNVLPNPNKVREVNSEETEYK